MSGNEFLVKMEICQILSGRKLSIKEIYEEFIETTNLRPVRSNEFTRDYIKTVLERSSDHRRRKRMIEEGQKVSDIYFDWEKNDNKVKYFLVDGYEEKLVSEGGDKINVKSVIEERIVNVRNSYEQSKWSKKIKDHWGNECKFCNNQISTVIESAHIRDEKDVLFFDDSNGIPLCKNCHALFDKNEIKISNQKRLKLYVSNEITKHELEKKMVDFNEEVYLNTPTHIDENKISDFIDFRNKKMGN